METVLRHDEVESTGTLATRTARGWLNGGPLSYRTITFPELIRGAAFIQVEK